MAFDLQTHIRNKKSGRIESKNAYRRHVSADGVKYERNGQFFAEDGTPLAAPETKQEKSLGTVINKMVKPKFDEAG